MKLSPEQRALLPSDEDVAFYREHGWYISKKILPDELIDEARYGSERHFAGDRDTPHAKDHRLSDWKPGDGDGLRNCEFVSLQNVQLRKLVDYPLIGAVAARLAGCPTIRMFDDQLLFKPSDGPQDGSVIGWHTDRAYWMTCTSENMLTAWIPFHDSSEDRAPLMVVDGSHRWSGTSKIRLFKEQNLEEIAANYKVDGVPFTPVPMVMEQGQVSFHHCRTIHGSDINRSDLPRLSFSIHMQDGDNRYRLYRNEQGIPGTFVDDDLCRTTEDGFPDYTDPDVFPGPLVRGVGGEVGRLPLTLTPDAFSFTTAPRPALHSGLYRSFGKRLFDLFVAAPALLLLSPVLGVLALLVRIKLGVPVFFRQARPGLNGRSFMTCKFRTMHDTRDEHGDLLPNGDRLPSFGRFLRSTSLDELPQLWNVVTGDMSLVGPRPLLVEYLPYYTERERIRHSVRPGLTGLAQISGRHPPRLGRAPRARRAVRRVAEPLTRSGHLVQDGTTRDQSP